jgi:hypothetical protein
MPVFGELRKVADRQLAIQAECAVADLQVLQKPEKPHAERAAEGGDSQWGAA